MPVLAASLLPASLLAATLLALPARAGPALVTATTGTVALVGQGAPTVPFLVPEGGLLELAQGASAVILVGGRAQRVEGPARLDPQTLARAEAQAAAAIDGLLDRRVDAAQAGATRSGGRVELLRPLPRAQVLDLDHVEWRCSETCPEVEVAILPLLDTTPAWTGRGAGRVEVDALVLDPGPWMVRLDGVDHGFVVPEDAAALRAQLGQVDAVAAGLPADDALGRASVQAAARWQAGLWTDALVVLDRAVAAAPEDAALAALRDAYLARAGLGP